MVGTATNGLKAIKEAKRLQPDVVTLDIEMPEMDGLTALRQIRRVCKAAVLMISSLTSEGSNATLTALRYGAADFIAKDSSQISLNIVKIEEELQAKVCAIAKANRERPVPRSLRVASTGPDDATVAKAPVLKAKDFDIVLIGSSTGGPPVLEQIVNNLPANFALPLVIAQHMPVLFTKTMAERLNKMSRIPVLHAEQDMPITKGHLYIGQGGQHMRLKRIGLTRYQLEISPLPPEELYKPSVNELFASAARLFGARVLAIVLTGIGEDGLRGARELHAKGAKILAQDHETCAVYGMPKAVTQAGLVMASLSPEELSKAVAQLTTEESNGPARNNPNN